MKTVSHDVAPLSNFILNITQRKLLCKQALQGDAHINKTSFYDLNNILVGYIDDSASLQNLSKHAIVNFTCAHPKTQVQ